MIEKYGTDLHNVPATDDQIREIKKLGKEAGLTLDTVGGYSNYKEASETIDSLKIVYGI